MTSRIFYKVVMWKIVWIMVINNTILLYNKYENHWAIHTTLCSENDKLGMLSFHNFHCWKGREQTPSLDCHFLYPSVETNDKIFWVTLQSSKLQQKFRCLNYLYYLFKLRFVSRLFILHCCLQNSKWKFLSSNQRHQTEKIADLKQICIVNHCIEIQIWRFSSASYILTSIYCSISYYFNIMIWIFRSNWSISNINM